MTIAPSLVSKLREYQLPAVVSLVNGYGKHSSQLDASEMGTGKAQPIDTPILTPHGWKPMGDIRVGDFVISGDGHPTRVMAVHPQGFKQVFRVTLNDNTWTECCDEHLWVINSATRRQRGRPWHVVPLASFRDNLKWKTNRRWFIPMVKPVHFAKQSLLIHPYLLGVLLGDGGMTQNSITLTSADIFIAGEVERLLPKGTFITKHISNQYGYQIHGSLSRHHGRRMNPLLTLLRSLGVAGLRSERKFVPEEYRLASPEQRLSLLQGLIDTDGHVDHRGLIEFSSTSRQLAEDVVFLTQSLGGRASLTPRQTYCFHKGTKRAGKPSYRVMLSLPICFEPARLPRKRVKLRKVAKYNPIRNIDTVVPIGARYCQCITVANPSGTYVTQSFIVTHNSFVALGTALASGRQPYILSRKAAFPSWRRYLKHFGVDPQWIPLTNLEAIKGGKRVTGTWVEARTVSGRKYKKFVWALPENSLLIWDEVHGAAGLDSSNSKMLIGAAFQKIPTLMLSATAADSPLKMKAIGFALGLHRVTDFYSWLLAHGCSEGKYGFEFNCDMKPGDYLEYNSKREKWDKKPEGWAELCRRRSAHMARIHQAIFPAGKGVRLRQCDIPGFPENTIVPEAIDFQGATAEIAKAYRDLNFELKQLAKKFEAGPLLKKTQMKVEMLKLPIIAEYAKDAIGEGYSVVIFTNFNESLDELSRLLKTDCVIRGGQTDEERARNEDRFQSNESPIVIANNQAGGESINFHDLEGGHPRLTYIFPTFWAQTFRQCSGRAPRQGAKTPVVQRIPFAAGTVEEDALTSIEAKLKQIDIFNGGEAVSAITDSDLMAGLSLVT